MALIDALREEISAGRFELSKHAADQRIIRRIEMRELREAVATGEVIEDYPDDKYGPSCLVLRTTATGRTLHIQCGHPTRRPVKIITLYEPTPGRWIDSRRRRPR